MAISITRLSGGNTPADGSDPRTFPAIWNATSDALEANVIPTDVTSPATGQLLQYNGTNWVNVGQADAGAIPVFADAAARTTAIPSPSEGMVTYRSDDDVVEVFDGSVFKAVGPGQILQVVSTTLTSAFSAAVISPNETAITGLTASITPSSTSSKILVLASVMVAVEQNGVQVTLNRDATEIAIGDSVGTVMRVTNGLLIGAYDAGNSGQQMANVNFLDSPATTSAITYSLTIGPTFAGAATRTVFVNRQQTTGTTDTVPRGVSTITVMEVAG